MKGSKSMCAYAFVINSNNSTSINAIMMTHSSSQYRQRARDLWPHITAPEMVLPITAHPAFEKVCVPYGYGCGGYGDVMALAPVAYD